MKYLVKFDWGVDMEVNVNCEYEEKLRVAMVVSLDNQGT